MAVAFHPEFEYVAVAEDGGDVYLVESRRHDPVLQETGLKATKILARIPGRNWTAWKCSTRFWTVRSWVCWPIT